MRDEMSDLVETKDLRKPSSFHFRSFLEEKKEIGGYKQSLRILRQFFEKGFENFYRGTFQYLPVELKLHNSGNQRKRSFSRSCNSLFF